MKSLMHRPGAALPALRVLGGPVLEPGSDVRGGRTLPAPPHPMGQAQGSQHTC